MEEATYLTRFCPEVLVVHRRDSLRASKIMQERAQANPRIRFLWNTEIVEVCPSCSPSESKPGVPDGGFIGNPDLGDSGRFMTDASFQQPDATALDAGPATMNDGGAASD